MNPPIDKGQIYAEGYRDGYRDRGLYQIQIDLKEFSSSSPHKSDDLERLLRINYPHLFQDKTS